MWVNIPYMDPMGRDLKFHRKTSGLHDSGFKSEAVFSGGVAARYIYIYMSVQIFVSAYRKPRNHLPKQHLGLQVLNNRNLQACKENAPRALGRSGSQYSWLKMHTPTNQSGAKVSY